MHTALGAAIGTEITSPVVAFSLAFISHFVLDAIPHGDQEFSDGKFVFSERSIRILKKLATADMAVLIFMHAILFKISIIEFSPAVIAAIFGAMLPDFINAFYLVTKITLLRWYYIFHYDLHFIWNGFTIPFKKGVIVQLVFLIFFMIILFY